ncbi:MAG: hypothetical protein LBI99_02100 [Propionibacteriaceae bacterium]|jgi:uncharacterized protein YycO|nr:hypothetical protein [Propionibacteriaceae bacterium]
MKKLLVVAAATAILCVGLAVPQAQAASAYPTRKGVILVTTDPWVSSWGVNFFTGFGHSATIYNKDYVVESVSKGVVKGRNDWKSSRKKVTAVTTYGTTAAQDAATADWAYGKIGKPYNFNFYDMGNRSKFYCSHLIWAAYKDKYKLDLNTSQYDINVLGVKKSAIAPTELISTSKTYTVYTQSR